MSVSDIEIVKVEPALGSNNHIFMQEQFFTNVWLKTSFPVQLLRPQLWTNATHKLNPEGKWHGIGKLFAHVLFRDGAFFADPRSGG